MIYMLWWIYEKDDFSLSDTGWSEEKTEYSQQAPVTFWLIW